MRSGDELSKSELELGAELAPRFDESGLIPAIVTNSDTGAVLMLAYMNAEALHHTMKTGDAHYFSRSRQSLWRKGETSGQIQKVKEIRIDCDQDTLWLAVEPQGDGGCCHVGFQSCFYRRVDGSDDTPRLSVDGKRTAGG